MEDFKNMKKLAFFAQARRRYLFRPRLLSFLLMLLGGVGIILGGSAWYTAARQSQLSVHQTAVSLAGAQALPVTAQQQEHYGVLSAAQALDAAGNPTGYAVVVQRTGYKSPIRLQVLLTADGRTLAGIRVLSQDETEYLGARIANESFAAGFAGRQLPVKLWTSAATGSPVDGLTGSTISAQAVVDAVNGAAAYVQALA